MKKSPGTWFAKPDRAVGVVAGTSLIKASSQHSSIKVQALKR
ncbi:MAG: hypothetical protein K0Q73_5070 [Paenibacillus sp.]|jgi:hypothetical protein|nr:hypothetical protein [Paenibacillus sp.]